MGVRTTCFFFPQVGVRTLFGVVWAGGMVILPRCCHCCMPTGKGFISLHLLCNHGHLKFGQKLIDVLWSLCCWWWWVLWFHSTPYHERCSGFPHGVIWGGSTLTRWTLTLFPPDTSPVSIWGKYLPATSMTTVLLGWFDFFCLYKMPLWLQMASLSATCVGGTSLGYSLPILVLCDGVADVQGLHNMHACPVQLSFYLWCYWL